MLMLRLPWIYERMNDLSSNVSIWFPLHPPQPMAEQGLALIHLISNNSISWLHLCTWHVNKRRWKLGCWIVEGTIIHHPLNLLISSYKCRYNEHQLKPSQTIKGNFIQKSVKRWGGTMKEISFGMECFHSIWIYQCMWLILNEIRQPALTFIWVWKLSGPWTWPIDSWSRYSAPENVRVWWWDYRVSALLLSPLMPTLHPSPARPSDANTKSADNHSLTAHDTLN